MASLSLRNNLIAATLAVAVAAFPALADTESADESDSKAFDIAARSDRSDNGFGDSRVDAVMVLRNAAGDETTRELSFTTLERADETVGDKSLVIFRTPRDVEGTALLSHAQIRDPDDQWLYLPALKRVKRISSKNKSGPFVGSEFAFEDFTALELNKYTYEYVEESDLTQGEETFAVDVITRYPAYENSGYTRQISYIDQDNLQVRRVEFFDRRGDLLKTLDLLDYREYGEGVWRSHLLSMTNHKTKKTTDLRYGDYEFGVGLGDNDFVKGVLTRVR